MPGRRRPADDPHRRHDGRRDPGLSGAIARACSPTSCERATRRGRHRRRRLRGRGAVVLGATVRLGQVDTVKHAREQRLSLRVFVGKRVGGRLHLRSLARVARAAWWTRRPRWPASRADGSARRACPTPASSSRAVPDLDLERPARPRPRARGRRSSWPAAREAAALEADPAHHQLRGRRSSATAARATPTRRRHGFAGELRDVARSASSVSPVATRERRDAARLLVSRRRASARALEAPGGDRPHRGAARAAPARRAQGEDRGGPGDLRPGDGGQPGAPHRRRGQRAQRSTAARPSCWTGSASASPRPSVTIVDDGTHPGRARLAPVRRRGAADAAHRARGARACSSPTCSTPTAARKLGLPSTHHAARDGSGVSVSTTNLHPRCRATTTRRS